MVTPEQTKELAAFVEQLARDLAERRISPEKVRFRMAHQLAQMRLLDRRIHVARRFDASSSVPRSSGPLRR